MPIPPYIRKIRKADNFDKKAYQSIFSKKIGSIAAPTASLHFDSRLIKELAVRYKDDPYLTNYLKEPDLYRWAFICDRVRCLLLKDIGGIYVDADALPIQSFDIIMNQLSENITFFTGMKPTQQNNTFLLSFK